MTTYAEFKERLIDTIGFDYSDPTIAGWLRMAEERFNSHLRIADMVQIDTATISEARVNLPSDWQELDFVRLIDGEPLQYISRQEMYVRNNSNEETTEGCFTVTGNYLILGGVPDEVDGIEVELSYYGSVPQLTDAATWLSTKHYGLLMAATMVAGSLHGVEDNRVPIWSEFASSQIATLNDAHKVSRISGSTIRKPRRKSFG